MPRTRLGVFRDTPTWKQAKILVRDSGLEEHHPILEPLRIIEQKVTCGSLTVEHGRQVLQQVLMLFLSVPLPVFMNGYPTWTSKTDLTWHEI